MNLLHGGCCKECKSSHVQNVRPIAWRSRHTIAIPARNCYYKYCRVGGCVSTRTWGARLARLKGLPTPGPCKSYCLRARVRAAAERQGPESHCVCSVRVTGRRPRREHRCSPDHNEGVGLCVASRGLRGAGVAGGRGLGEKEAGRSPTSSAGGVWAGRRTPPGTGLRASVELAPRSPGPAPGAPPLSVPGWLEPAATRGDLPRAASLKPLPVPAPAGWSGRQRRGRLGLQGATPLGRPALGGA